MTSVPTAKKPDEPASKNPGGLLGKGWQNKSTTDPATIREWFDPPPTVASGATMAAALASDFYREVPYDTLVLGIHTGPNLVVVDIDDWEHVPEHIRTELASLDVPFQSSSTRDPRRGHYLFSPRPGYRYGAGALPTGPTGNSPGEVRHGNSIIVSAPSEHAKAHLGRRYEWQRTGTPPIMSEAVAEWCGRNGSSQGSSWQETVWNGHDLLFDAATTDAVETFVNKCTVSYRESITDEHIAYMVRLSDDSLHNAFLGPLVDLVKFMAFGFVNGPTAVEKALATFVSLRTDPARGALGGNVASEEAAHQEFFDLLTWAVGKTQAQIHVDFDALQYEAYDQIRTHYAYDLVVPMERPDNVPEPAPAPPMPALPVSIHYDGDREPVRATHAAVSAALVKHLQDKVRWCLDQRVWYVYNEHEKLWDGKKENEDIVASMIKGLLQTTVQPVSEMTFAKAIHQAQLAKNDREVARLTSLVTNTLGSSMSDTYAVGNDIWAESMSAREGIQKALATEAELHCLTRDFDSQSDRMAVANGVLDLSPLTNIPPKLPILLEDSPDHMITFRSSTAYDPTATAPTWRDMIESAFDDPAVNPFLATWFGLCIDRQKNFGKFLLAYGKSHSGKGMIFGLGSSLVFGNPKEGKSLVAAADKNLIVKSGMDVSNHRRRVIAELRGKAMAYIDESGDGGSIDTDQLKSYTGGMPQQGERKFENEIVVDVPPLVVSSNHEWRLGDVDAGTSNRIIALYFAYGHGAGAPVDRPDDPMLPSKIVSEASGVLNWALEGYMMWVQSGRILDIPASVQSHTEDMNSTASEFGTYLDLALEVTGDPNDTLTFRELWDGWDDHTHGYKATHLSRSAASQVAPRGIRTMRKSVEEHLAGVDGVVVTDRKVRQQAVHGVKLSAEGTKFVQGAAWLNGLQPPT